MDRYKPNPPPPLTPLEQVKDQLHIRIGSWGIKNDPIPYVDFYLDCRGAADAFQAGITGTGDDLPVQEWIRKHSQPARYLLSLEEAFSRLTTRRGVGKEFARPFYVLCLCARGIHRSRAVKHILIHALRQDGYQFVSLYDWTVSMCD